MFFIAYGNNTHNVLGLVYVVKYAIVLNTQLPLREWIASHSFTMMRFQCGSFFQAFFDSGDDDSLLIGFEEEQIRFSATGELY